jgi:hypothetical protein
MTAVALDAECVSKNVAVYLYVVYGDICVVYVHMNLSVQHILVHISHAIDARHRMLERRKGNYVG